MRLSRIVASAAAIGVCLGGLTGNIRAYCAQCLLDQIVIIERPKLAVDLSAPDPMRSEFHD